LVRLRFTNRKGRSLGRSAQVKDPGFMHGGRAHPSTGVVLFPPKEACSIAVSIVVEWLATHQFPQLVTFCCFSHTDAKLYRKRLGV